MSDGASAGFCRSATCHDSIGRQCGTFWVYDLDDIEDGNTADAVTTQDACSFAEDSGPSMEGDETAMGFGLSILPHRYTMRPRSCDIDVMFETRPTC